MSDKRPAYEPAGRLLAPLRYDPDMRRPMATVAGFVLVLLRVVAGVLWSLQLSSDWISLGTAPSGDDAEVLGLDISPELVSAGLISILVVGAVVLLVEVVLAILVLRGHNVARVIVMMFAVVSISGTFATWWFEGQEIALGTTFLTLALDILVLLALSSRDAAAYARRNQRR